MFSLFFVFTLMYYLCEKNYKPTVAQYYITDSVGGTPKLTLLGLWTNWTYEFNLRTQFTHMYGSYCII